MQYLPGVFWALSVSTLIICAAIVGRVLIIMEAKDRMYNNGYEEILLNDKVVVWRKRGDIGRQLRADLAADLEVFQDGMAGRRP